MTDHDFQSYLSLAVLLFSLRGTFVALQQNTAIKANVQVHIRERGCVAVA